MSGTALAFFHVGFRYAVPEGEEAGPSVLSDASFAVPEGSFAILSGQYGSGKTTLLRLA